MPDSNSDSPTADELGERTLVDLQQQYESDGLDTVDGYLRAALTVAHEDACAAIGVSLDELPGVVYNGLRQGGAYNPGTDELVLRKPRTPTPAGWDLLRLGRPSLLAILTTGLVSAANQRLVDRYFADNVAATAHIHDRETKTLEPGIDAGFAAPITFFLDATDPGPETWDAFLSARSAWYRTDGRINERRFEAIARTVGDRVQASDGPVHAALRDGLSIREPLIARGDRSVIALD